MKIKNLFSLFAVLVLTFGWVEPALAANRSKIEILYSPTSAYQGENVEVSFKVTKKGGKPEKWQVAIPKSTVSYVSDPGLKGLSLSETSTDYVLTFSLKGLKDRQEIVVNLALRSDIQSSYPLMTLYNGNGDLIEQRMIEVLVPQLSWSVESPFSYPVATNFQIILRAVNNTTMPIAFNVATEFFHQCTDKSVYPSTYPVNAVNGGGSTSSYWLWFEGEVPAGQTYTWIFDLRTGNVGCNAPVFELRDKLQGELSVWKQWLIVLAPNP